MFRLQWSTDGIEWSQASAPSKMLTSKPLPKLDRSGVRIELRLRTEQRDHDMLQTKLDVAEDIARALSIPIEAVQVLDIYGAGQYIVVELRDAIQGKSDSTSGASLLAQQLGLLGQQLARGETWGLSAGKVTHELDGGTGVQLLTPDGRLTPILVSEAATAALERLPRVYGPSGAGDTLLSSAKQITLAAVMFLIAAACVHGVYHHSNLMEQHRAATMGYADVSREEAAGICENDIKTFSSRKPSRGLPPKKHSGDRHSSRI